MNGSKRCSRAVRLGLATFLYFGCCLLGSAEGFARPQFGLGAAKQKNKHDEPPPPSALTISTGIARLTLKETLSKGFASKQRAPKFSDSRMNMTGVQFRPDGLMISVEGGQCALLFNEIPGYLKARTGNVELSLHFVGSLNWEGADSAELARRTANALNRLLYDAWHGHSTADADLEAFRQRAAAWRALQTKPKESEEVYKERLLAEDALKRKQILTALEHYEAGVAADRTWAQGWFNAALLYAELGEYLDAVAHMNRYLILLPDAQDAKTAKDNVILWEAKAWQQ